MAHRLAHNTLHMGSRLLTQARTHSCSSPHCDDDVGACASAYMSCSLPSAQLTSALHCCCRSIGADVLIDDNVGYALDCANNGIQVLLYDWEDSYPWSKLPEG